MKTFLQLVVLATLLLSVAVNLLILFDRNLLPVHAQSFGSLGVGPIAPLVTNCQPGTVGYAIFCPVGSGTAFQMYVSYNAGAYAPLVGAPAAVTSFNGRIGAVVSVAGDYSYAQLSSPPTTVNCQATGCVIK